ncbi:DoxX family protein [Streptomyces sp. NPDC050997]|uniref:DoxX family protein n=1 Tax=Streptomyces sp. NPDC050997 TaxID=3155519 RepID=UPI00344A9126
MINLSGTFCTSTTHTRYWIVAGLLALFYLYAGAMKVLRSRDQLRPMMAWVDRIPLPAARALGTVEILGATGLILPPLTGIAPWLALAATIGFVLLQIGAIAVPLTGEDRQITLNVGLIATAAVIIWLATTWL